MCENYNINNRISFVEKYTIHTFRPHLQVPGPPLLRLSNPVRTTRRKKVLIDPTPQFRPSYKSRLYNPPCFSFSFFAATDTYSQADLINPGQYFRDVSHHCRADSASRRCRSENPEVYGSQYNVIRHEHWHRRVRFRE